MRVSFFVPGTPKPAGSKRAFVNKKTGKAILTDMSGQAGKDWRHDVQGYAQEAMNGKPLLSGPLELRVDFFMPRPKSHYQKNGDHKATAPYHHTIRPDATKLLRGVEDALTGIVYHDDAQISVQVVRKCYGTPPGANIFIYERVLK